jgi:transposase
MAKVQKVSTREFKEEAVRLVQTSGKSIAQVARELGISDTRVHQWRKELTEHSKEAFPESRTPDETRRRKPPPQTGVREGTTGARHTKKRSEHLFTGIPMRLAVYRPIQARISRCGHVPGDGCFPKRLLRLAQASSLSTPTRRCSAYPRDATGLDKPSREVWESPYSCRAERSGTKHLLAPGSPG